jgi:hypothetical protein
MGDLATITIILLVCPTFLHSFQFTFIYLRFFFFFFTVSMFKILHPASIPANIRYLLNVTSVLMNEEIRDSDKLGIYYYKKK